MRSIINRAISAARREGKNTSWTAHNNRYHDTHLDETLPDQKPGPEEAFVSEEDKTEVWAELGNLKPEQRAAIFLRYYLELSEEEISLEMEKSKNSIKGLLFSARKTLRKLLRPSPAFEEQPERENGQRSQNE